MLESSSVASSLVEAAAASSSVEASATSSSVEASAASSSVEASAVSSSVEASVESSSVKAVVESSSVESSMVCAGVIVVTAGASFPAALAVFIVPRGAVSRSGDCCGVDAAAEVEVVVLDGPLTEPFERRSSSWAKPIIREQIIGTPLATYCSLHSTIRSIYPSRNTKSRPSIPETLVLPISFLQCQH